MGRVEISGKLKELFGNYKYVLLILCIGICLMLFPDNDNTVKQKSITAPALETPAGCEEKLEEILGQIEGVGKTKVLLTEAEGSQTIYQTDKDITGSQANTNQRIETVIVTNSNREERGLIRSVTPPVYLGAIIVCQGGDIPSVRLSVVQAVSNVTGISTDRIAVLKMK